VVTQVYSDAGEIIKKHFVRKEQMRIRFSDSFRDVDLLHHF